MPDFRNRSKEAEWIDSSVSRELLYENLRELDFLNRNFGGHSASCLGLTRLITDKNKIYHIIDFGCGGGDTIIYMAKWARKLNYRLRLTGVDKNRQIIEYVQHKISGFPEISAQVADYKKLVKMGVTADIIHCSLFCHHLSDEDLEEFFIYIKNSARVGFVINDLIRSPLAYYLVSFLTRIINSSGLSKNDGPVSVLRGFTMNELHVLLKNASLENYEISRKWAFRILITGHANSRK